MVWEIVLIHYIIILVLRSVRRLQVLRRRNYTKMMHTCMYVLELWFVIIPFCNIDG